MVESIQHFFCCACWLGIALLSRPGLGCDFLLAHVFSDRVRRMPLPMKYPHDRVAVNAGKRGRDADVSVRFNQNIQKILSPESIHGFGVVQHGFSSDDLLGGQALEVLSWLAVDHAPTEFCGFRIRFWEAVGASQPLSAAETLR
jgi:hypothetical protein